MSINKLFFIFDSSFRIDPPILFEAGHICFLILTSYLSYLVNLAIELGKMK